MWGQLTEYMHIWRKVSFAGLRNKAWAGRTYIYMDYKTKDNRIVKRAFIACR